MFCFVLLVFRFFFSFFPFFPEVPWEFVNTNFHLEKLVCESPNSGPAPGFQNNFSSESRLLGRNVLEASSQSAEPFCRQVGACLGNTSIPRSQLSSQATVGGEGGLEEGHFGPRKPEKERHICQP